MILLSRPSKTARQLAQILECPIVYKPSIVPSEETVIRWGNTAGNFEDEINPRKAIVLTSDKYAFLRLLEENSLPIPHIGSDRFPCIGRTRHHERGRGFWYCQNYLDVAHAKRKGAEYFLEFYPKTKEYRVHIGFRKP